MDSLTLELFRWLQSGPYDESGLTHIRSLLRTRRRALLAQNDQIALTEIVQLLQGWAEASKDPSLASAALSDASEIAEQDLRKPALANELRARSREPVAAAHGVPPIGAAADAALAERLSSAGDYDGAIEAYERALSSEADMDVVRKLAELYAQRSGPEDAQQAADLFYTLGDVLGNPAGVPMLERALEQAPAHADALALLSEYRASQSPGAAAALAANLAPKDVPAARVPVIDAPIELGAISPPSASDATRSQAAGLFTSSASPPPGAQVAASSRRATFGSGTLAGGLQATGASAGTAQASSSPTDSRTGNAPPNKPRGERSPASITLPGGTAAVDPSQWPIPGAARAGTLADRVSPAPAALRTAAATDRASAAPGADRTSAAGVGATATGTSAASGSKRAIAAPAGMGTVAAAGRASAAHAPPDVSADRRTTAPGWRRTSAAPSVASTASVADADRRPTAPGWKRTSAAPSTASTASAAGRASVAPGWKRVSTATSAASAGRASAAPGSTRASAAPGEKTAGTGLAATLGEAAPAPHYVTPHLRVRSPAELEAALNRMQRTSSPQELSADGELPLPSTSLSPVVREDTLVVQSESRAHERRRWVGAAIGASVAAAAAAFLVVSYASRPAPAAVAGRVDIPTPAAASQPSTAPTPAAIGGMDTQPAVSGTPQSVVTPPPSAATDPGAAAARSSAGATPAPPGPGASHDGGDRAAKKAARQPSARPLFGAVDLRGGKLNEQQLAAAVDRTTPKLERCYARVLEDRPHTKGRLTVGWTIQLSGRPVAVKKLGGSIKNPALTRCTLQVIGNARFPKPRKQPAHVRLPIDYRRS